MAIQEGSIPFCVQDSRPGILVTKRLYRRQGIILGSGDFFSTYFYFLIRNPYMSNRWTGGEMNAKPAYGIYPNVRGTVASYNK